MTKFRKPFSIGRVNKIYRTLTGIYAWSPIMRHFTTKNINTNQFTITKIDTCIKVLKEWKESLK